MKKLIKGLICATLCGAMALAIPGCKGKSGLDPEKDTLRLSIGAVDQKFNPMFYTAQNDGEVIAPTQIALITTEAVGNTVKLACGENQPTLALDYQETYYSADGAAIGSGTGDGSVKGASSTAEGSTVYEFVIKNGVKDSTGTDLNVMDVLFNLYVYLDPAYTGSSTIYSTKIKGLQAYRQQDPDADESSSDDLSKYYGLAMDRINTLVRWSEDNTVPVESQLSENAQKDLTQVKKLYQEELNTDWSSIETSWVESYKEYNFTAAWQVFMYVEGLVNRQWRLADNGSTEYIKGENGKYLTTLDPDWSTGDVDQQALIDDMNKAVSDAGATTDAAILAAQKNWAIKHIYDSNTAPKQIAFVLTSCATANTALEYFAAEERTKDFENKKVNGELAVKSIEGITVYKSKKLVNQYSHEEKTYTEDHDILRIEIQGVDPKAKWNFGVTVAPMHYYSTQEYYNKAMNDYNTGKVYDGTATNFGVEFNDINWMNNNLLADNKTSLPVGAGPYKCSTSGKTPATSGVNFFDGSIAYYERNEYFETLGSGIDNAKIKYMQYKVIRDDMIISALTTGEIYYGEPLATATNLAEFANRANLKTITYQTGGYGYVGINPKYVPDMEVRQAIMMAMDTSSIRTYYGSNLVNIINRPVSSTSWASKVQWGGEDWDRYYPLATDDASSSAEEKIRQKVLESGNWYYDEASGKLKSVEGDNPLKYTFTIAGESLDHPAYRMFVNAELLLESAGFEISVEQDIRALKKLARGDLAVWAAAWSSSIDPDPYQIYSKNSKTTSTRNWNKDGIYNDATGKFDREKAIAEDLNTLINQGRETLDQNERIDKYEQCYELIMQLAVEFPTYQRNDLCVYDENILDVNTMSKNPSYLLGPIDELWKLNYKK